MSMQNRTLITGAGIFSCLGPNLREVNRALYHGWTGIAERDELVKIGCQSRLRGILDNPDEFVSGLVNRRQLSRMGPESRYAVIAVDEALRTSRFSPIQSARVGLIVSNDSTISANDHVHRVMQERRDSRALGSSSVFKVLNSSVSMNLAQLFGPFSLSLTVSAACAGGAHAVGLAHTLIKSGTLDAAVVVGAQENEPQSFSAFDALGVIAKDSPDYLPHTASRPFSSDRIGLVPSGGAACLILESEKHHRLRGAAFSLATVDGYGFSTSDSIVSPSHSHLKDCMRAALDNAGISNYDEIDILAAHATGTRAGDIAEARAIYNLFAGCDLRVTATKALSGHECWMSGVSQIVYTLLQLHGGFVAPYPHFAGFDIDTPSFPLIKEGLFGVHPRRALCNAFGFGGTNASLIITKRG